MSSGNRFLKDNDSVFRKGSFPTNWNSGAIQRQRRLHVTFHTHCYLVLKTANAQEFPLCTFHADHCLEHRNLPGPDVSGVTEDVAMVHTFNLMKLPVRSSFFSFVRLPQMFAICWRAVTVIWSDDPSTCKPLWERSRSVIFVRVKITGVLSLIPCTPSTFFLMWRPVTISGWIKWKSIC